MKEQNTKLYDVSINEILRKVVTVKAGSRKEAEAIVEEAWSNSEYVLDADDFSEVKFEATEHAPFIKRNNKEER